jgi:branched-chain amino acid transport system substrate-binding protein
VTNTLITRRSVMTLAANAVAFNLTHKAIAQSAEPYKVGFLMPLTGGAGKLGAMMLEGSQLAVDEINGGGGIAGRKIELLQEDSQALARNGIDGFRKLVDVDRVPIIITGWTSVSVAIAPLATQSKTYLLSGSTASPAVRSVSPYFQSTSMYDDESVRVVLPYARNELKVGKLGIVTVISDLGAGLSASIKSAWEKLGGSGVVEEAHQAQESNFRPMLLKMMTANPDAIYITSSVGKQSAQIVRQARELGYTGYFLSFGAFEDPEVLTLGTKADKCVYTAPGFDAGSADPQTKMFVDRFHTRFAKIPNVHQANHYDLIQIFKEVAEPFAKAGKPLTGEAFRGAFMTQLPEYVGAGGRYRFNFADGSVIRSTVVKTVRDGAFVKIADPS